MFSQPKPALNVPAADMTPLGRAAAVQPFKFQLRRETVDWRRINAVDIDMVMNQMDVDILQEHIKVVTFCCLDGERCQRCRSPMDPALVKLFQLAQLTVEWLLHCQEFLTLSLQEAEESLTAASGERKKLLAQQKKQEEKVKALTAELKQRKAAPRVQSYPKCPHCDKFFCNPTYLQSHLERKHSEERESQRRVGREKTSEVESLKMEINGLKDQILQQQQQLQGKRSQENEQLSFHTDLLREIGRLKAEVACADRKLEDSRDQLNEEMKFLHHKFQLCIGAAQNQPVSEGSAVRSQAERDADSAGPQTQVLEKLEREMEERNKKWESRLQDIKSHHESEKNLLFQLITMQLSVSDQQEHSQRLQQELERELQEKQRVIKAQEKQLRRLSSSPRPRTEKRRLSSHSAVPSPEPERTESVHEVDAKHSPEKKPKVRRAEPEVEPAPKKKTAVLSRLKSSSSVRKDMRKEMEQAVVKKLAHLRVDPEKRGLKNKDLASILAKVQSMRLSFAKGKPETWRHRETIASLIEHKLLSQRGGAPNSNATAEGSRRAGRSKTPPPSSILKPQRQTSHLSSDDHTEEEEEEHLSEPLPEYQSTRQQAKQSRATRGRAKASKSTTASKASAGPSGLASPGPSLASPGPSWKSVRGPVTRIAVTEGKRND